MVKGVEDLRTPLKEIIDLDVKLRGTLSGFLMPSFIIDLPEGGGKRLVSTYKGHDAEKGSYTYEAPGLHGDRGKRDYTYFDPKPVKATELAALEQQKVQALATGQTLEQIAQTTFFNPSHGRVSTPKDSPTPVGDTKHDNKPAVGRDERRWPTEQPTISKWSPVDHHGHEYGGQEQLLAASG